MAIHWELYPFFRRVEFDSPDAPGTGDSMQPVVIRCLHIMRLSLGVPMIVTSGFRTRDHNFRVGGSNYSEHLWGYAADIACDYSRYRYQLVKAAYEVGCPRIEFAPTWIHLGWSPIHPQNVAFYPLRPLQPLQP